MRDNQYRLLWTGISTSKKINGCRPKVSVVSPGSFNVVEILVDIGVIVVYTLYMMKPQPKILTCLRCDYVWQSRVIAPVMCPRCRSPYFNTPRKTPKKESK